MKWKVKLPGSGTATPIVWEDKIFIASAINTKKKPEGAAAAAANPAGTEPAARRPRGNQSREQEQGSTGALGQTQADETEPRPLQDWQKRYDIDNDGKLDEKEQAAMRDAFRNRRNRGGGQGGGGGGGFGGGGKPTEIHQFVLACLDRKTGKQLWQSVAREEVPHEGHHRDHGFASASPITDGEHIIVSFGSRGVFCFDMDGKKIWEKDLGDMRTRAGFGEGTSPALHGDTVVITWAPRGRLVHRCAGQELGGRALADSARRVHLMVDPVHHRVGRQTCRRRCGLRHGRRL